MSIYATLAFDEAVGLDLASDQEAQPPHLHSNRHRRPFPARDADEGFDPWHWRPLVSAPHIERAMILHSVFAQKALRTLFGRLQMAAYGMSVTIPILERDQGRLGDELEQTFVAALERILALQAKTRERCRHWLGAQATLPGVRYQPQSETLVVYTPMANHALAVFQGLDETIMQIDALWYAGVLSASQAKRAILEARSQVKNFVNEMDGLWRRSKSSLRKTQPLGSVAAAAPELSDDSVDGPHQEVPSST
ncbi:MAG: hypothetical protein IPK97_05135 [Ahniella sp.]|nr:hypothetical protein [Ahniella sp.]